MLSRNLVLGILVITLLMTLTVYPIKAQEEISYKVLIINSIEEQGGGLKIRISLTPSQNIQNVLFYLPRDILRGNYFIEGYYKGEKLTPDVSYLNDTAKIEFKGVNLSGNEKLMIVVYIPNDVDQTGNGGYIADFLSNIVLDHSISSLTTRVNLPPNTKVIKPPDGYAQYQVTARGVRPQLYRLEKTFSIEELEKLDKPNAITINMTSINREYASIKILDMNITMLFTINPDSTVHCKEIIEAINTGVLSWSPSDSILIFKHSMNYKNINAHTQLNRKLNINSTSSIYEVSLPYEVKPGGKVIIILEFDVSNSTKKSGLLGNIINYRFKISNITENMINLLNITVTNYGGRILYTNIWHNYTQYSDEIKLEGTTTIQPLDLVTYSGVGYAIVFIIAIGLILSGYQLYIKAGLRELPDEARKYFNKFRRLTLEMNKLIELESIKLEGKISERDYLKKKAEINRRINQFRRDIEIGRKTIEGIAAENSYVKEVLDEIKEIEKYWEELRRLDEEFRRKRVKPKRYKERRKEIISIFKTHLTRLESKL